MRSLAILILTTATASAGPASFVPKLPAGRLAGPAGLELVVQRDPAHCQGTAIAVRHVGPAASEPELVAVFDIDSPHGLDFTRDLKGSKARFETWVADFKARGAKAIEHYEPLLADRDQQAAAAARLVQIEMRLAQLLGHMEIPIDTRAGEFAEWKIEAFCGRMNELAAPLIQRAAQLAEQCARLSAGRDGWWNAVCPQST